MTVDAAAVPDGTLRRLIPTVIGLGLTQIIGWGTSFSAIAILGTPMGLDLGLARELVFAGITIMLVSSAALSPWAGRRLDRTGPRLHMASGSALAALALLLMASANGVVVFWLAWALFGLSIPLSLTNAAVPAIVQIAGPHARRAVTGLTIIGGTTSLFFLPLTAWLAGMLGWRSTLLVFAIMQIAVALPIHLAVLPSGPTRRQPQAPSEDVPWKGIVPDDLKRRAFVLLVTWSCLEGMLVWGFNLQAIDILQGLGLSATAAIGVWMFSSPSQAIARVIEFALAGRYTIMTTAIVSASLAPIGFALFYAAGVSVPSATLMAICYGLGHGLFAIARNMLPLRLFGLETFGATMGRMALPQNLSNALAPIIIAALVSRAGPMAAFVFSVGCALASLCAVLALARLVARVDAIKPAPASPAEASG
jgi:MFS family permease